jgi:hypothetical protein
LSLNFDIIGPFRTTSNGVPVLDRGRLTFTS